MTRPGLAQFGREITDGFKLTEEIVVADPIKSCAAANNGNEFWGKIVLVERGDCMFVEKARVLESQGAKGGIVLDNNPESDSNGGSNMFAMSGDGTGRVTISTTKGARCKEQNLHCGLSTQLMLSCLYLLQN